MFLAGRRAEPLDRVADRIRACGGQVRTAQLDLTDEAAVDRHVAPVEQELAALAEATMLKRLPSLADAGEAAAFLASGRAGAITAGAINLTAGAVPD